MVAVPLSDSHYEKMVDYIVEESASDSDNEVEWQEVRKDPLRRSSCSLLLSSSTPRP
jgi:hypothetical protein